VILLKFIITILLIATSLLAQVPDIVPLSWLQKHYNDNNLVLIDVRDAKKFHKSHLKKAVNVPVFDKLFYGPKMVMPPLTQLKKIFSQAGIDDKSEIVVYGGTNPIWSARFYWISKVLGAKNVGILQTSFGNWPKNTFPVTSEIYKPAYKDFAPKIDNTILDTKLDVLTSIGKANIIDGRPSEFYVGKKSHAKRHGHIPKAYNFPGSLTYDTNGSKSSIKEIEQLKELYTNLPHNKPVILYCEDGADAAMNFLVLKKLGYKVSVYDGSWLEWGNDEHLPVETKINKP